MRSGLIRLANLSKPDFKVIPRMVSLFLVLSPLSPTLLKSLLLFLQTCTFAHRLSYEMVDSTVKRYTGMNKEIGAGGVFQETSVDREEVPQVKVISAYATKRAVNGM